MNDTPVQSAARAKNSALLRKRYRAEARFRLCGFVSLAISSLFLVALIGNIFMTGWPAFWHHAVVLEVPVTAEQTDPDNKANSEPSAAVDYRASIRQALDAAIPGIEGRAARKQLIEIISSSGAEDDLRRIVASDPTVVGKSVKVALIVSDDSDLFLKGTVTNILRQAGTLGAAKVSGTSGEVTVQSASDDFSSYISEIKAALRAQAAELRSEADRIDRRSGGQPSEKAAELRVEASELEKRSGAPDAAETLDSRAPSVLVHINGGVIKAASISNNAITGEALIPLTSAGEAAAGAWEIATYVTPESNRSVSDRKVAFLDKLKREGKVENGFNWRFFTSGDSREPELAGIRGAVIGSVLTLLVTLGLCLPIGVMAAIYLEEFAPKNRLTDFIEININNLAAVPSIVFGLLGLAVFLNFFQMPRSAPIVGGLVLALLVLPTIIISARAALKSVPPSIREGAYGVGASKQQAILHHVLPLATPGIMTGTIIGMAHALGETAPLLMIGMVAFIVDVPKSLSEAATVLPVQIYLWSDLPEAAFQSKTAAAIVVLLLILFLMNGAAIWLRKKFERRW